MPNQTKNSIPRNINHWENQGHNIFLKVSRSIFPTQDWIGLILIIVQGMALKSSNVKKPCLKGKMIAKAKTKIKNIICFLFIKKFS